MFPPIELNGKTHFLGNMDVENALKYKKFQSAIQKNT